MLHFLVSSRDSGPQKKRICKLGAGVERTSNKSDTPGFPLSSVASVVQDIRGFKRLELPRNHRRLSQSSLLLAQSWRANCDVQILLYDSDPMHPNPEDVARATDYIVAYACKGVETLQEERRQMIDLVLRGHETFSDKTDVQKLARQLLNRAVGEKMISKQEAMVHIGQLDLVDCSESIDTVSISGYYKLTKGKAATTFLKKYATRSAQYKDATLHEYFHILKNKDLDPSKTNAKYVPHYVGANCHPHYPPTIPYARSIVLLHVPWRGTFDVNQDFIQRFNDLITSPSCPLSVQIPYLRMKARVQSKFASIEPTNINDDPINPFLSDRIPTDLKEAIEHANMLPSRGGKHDSDDLQFNYGVDFDWSTQHYPVRCLVYLSCALVRNFLTDVFRAPSTVPL